MNKTIAIVIVVIIIIIGAGVYFTNKTPVDDVVVSTNTTTTSSSTNSIQATTTVDKTKTVIGTSVEGREITAYHYGEGDTELLFIGGIHGGYEANTSLVAYELMDYLVANPSVIASNLKVTVIPLLNPDGLSKVATTTDGRFTAADVSSSQDKQTAGRFNANTVDLNRNFDCDWQASAKWQNKTVSGGTAAFSEPESQAIKAYVEAGQPQAVVVWYSAAGGVYASSCHNGVSVETNTLTSKYAAASGYGAHQSFNFYEITGDMVNWLAKNNIPAISVLLTNHTDTEWTKNQAGVEALLKHYAK